MNEAIVIGSTALQMYKPFENIVPKDLDIVVESDDILKLAEIVFNSEDRLDIHIWPKHILSLMETTTVDHVQYATPATIMTIKASHLEWDIKFDKNLRHYKNLKLKGFQLNIELYHTLIEYWKDVHGDKEFLSLKQSKESFFNDFVECPIDHDLLHEMVSFPAEPMYKKTLANGEDVLISPEKFGNLDYHDKIKMFNEEIIVIAVERWLLNDPKIGYKEAYKRALKLTLTNLTKGWASAFIIRNILHFTPKYRDFGGILSRLNLVDFDAQMHVADLIRNSSIEEVVEAIQLIDNTDNGLIALPNNGPQATHIMVSWVIGDTLELAASARYVTSKSRKVISYE